MDLDTPHLPGKRKSLIPRRGLYKPLILKTRPLEGHISFKITNALEAFLGAGSRRMTFPSFRSSNVVLRVP